MKTAKSQFRINQKKYEPKNNTKSVQNLKKVGSFITSVGDPPGDNEVAKYYSSIDDERSNDLLNRSIKRTLILYEENLLLYKNNENKLQKLIQNHMREQNFAYYQNIFNFIRTKDQSQLTSKVINAKLMHQLIGLNDFLAGLYERKKARQIQIINENLKEQEAEIAKKLELGELYLLYQDLDFLGPVNSIDLITQYQRICTQFGAPEPFLRQQSHVRNQLDTCRANLKNHFDFTKKLGEKYRQERSFSRKTEKIKSAH